MNIENTLGAINTTGTVTQPYQPVGAETSNPNLQKACKAFEGMLLNIIMKQALSSDASNEDTATGNDILKEFSIEHTARQLGDSDAFGLGKILYKQMTNNTMQREKK